MKITRREFVGTIPALAVAASASPLMNIPLEPDDIWQLWYRQPARRWLEALPVGNGRLAAMVFGGIEEELLKLNESTVWSGSPNLSNVNPSGRNVAGSLFVPAEWRSALRAIQSWRLRRNCCRA